MQLCWIRTYDLMKYCSFIISQEINNRIQKLKQDTSTPHQLDPTLQNRVGSESMADPRSSAHLRLHYNYHYKRTIDS